MYGILLENLAEYIKVGYGEDMWETVRREAMVDVPSFSTHQVYPESMIPRLAKGACKVRACRVMSSPSYCVMVSVNPTELFPSGYQTLIKCIRMQSERGIC